MACVTLAQEDEICLVDGQMKLKDDNLMDIETGDDNIVNKMMHRDLEIIFTKFYRITKISLIWINRKLWYVLSYIQNVFICRNDLINIE